MEPVRFGKFLLVDQIASGGMAEIYKSIGVMTGGTRQTLAIKRILPQYSRDAEFISLLIDEAKLMVFLNHPNIVPIVEFGKVDESYYIAMDFVEGTTLKGLFKKVLKQREKIPINMALHIVREICSGLAYAHRKVDKNGKPLKLVHRDISPANILISFEGEVKIADFGISKAANQTHRTQIGIIRGKTGYMSPEQTKAGIEIDHRSDLYSLGIILYELVTGVRLFRADSVPEALRIVRKGEVPPLTTFRPEVTPKLEAIVRKALAVDPNDRFQRGEEFIDAINEYLTRHASKGRAVRVTHTDLVDFLWKFFEGEMEANTRAILAGQRDQVSAAQPYGMKKSSQPRIKKTELTRPQTIAANPLFEISEPQYIVPPKPFQSNPSTKTGTPFDVKSSLKSAPEAVVKTVQKNPSILLTLLAIVAVSAVIFFTKSQKDISIKIPPPIQLIEFSISSDPPGAKIFLNDQKQDIVTPGKISVQEGRNITLALKSSGYEDVTHVIHPRSGMLPIHFKLTPLKELTKKLSELANARIISDPPGARLFVDGKLMPGVTPLSIPVKVGKRLTLRLEAKGYKSKYTTLQINEPGNIEKAIFLDREEKPRQPRFVARKPTPKPRPTVPLGEKKIRKISKPGKLSVSTSPWSNVYLDGNQIGVSPFLNKEIPGGRHVLRFTNPQLKLKPYEVTVNIRPGKSMKCIYDFDKRRGSCK